MSNPSWSLVARDRLEYVAAQLGPLPNAVSTHCLVAFFHQACDTLVRFVPVFHARGQYFRFGWDFIYFIWLPGNRVIIPVTSDFKLSVEKLATFIRIFSCSLNEIQDIILHGNRRDVQAEFDIFADIHEKYCTLCPCTQLKLLTGTTKIILAVVDTDGDIIFEEITCHYFEK